MRPSRMSQNFRLLSFVHVMRKVYLCDIMHQIHQNMKYPIGIQTFSRIREDGYVYVDKTALIYQLASKGSIYFLSRPRRFGKSLMISTLEAYYEGRKELFEGLAIAELEKDWFQYPVFHVDFNGDNFAKEGVLEAKIEGFIAQGERRYGKDPDLLTMGDRFEAVLRHASEKTGRRAVVLVDEYDKPILDVLDTPMEEKNRDTLKAFYSTFKGADKYLQFVMLTGVTKFSQVSVFSGFNQPKDISMDPRYEALCGITKEEMEHYFHEPTVELSEKEECTYDEMKDRLRAQYDGYHFSENMLDIYNPFSILNAFDSLQIRDYWFASGTPTYLVRLLQHSHEQINELAGKYYDASLFADYKADVEQPLPMIYQSGYLTIKGYDKRRNRYLLDFPNNEVRKGFLSVIASSYLKPRHNEITSWVSDAAVMLEDGETTELRDSFTAFLSSIPYDSHHSTKTPELTEKHFQYTFYLILRLIGVYCLHIEQTQSQGRVDCILETPLYIYIFEFKLDGSADEALRQIEEKGYATPYLGDKRKIVRIGVVFSSQTRTISEWKEG